MRVRYHVDDGLIAAAAAWLEAQGRGSHTRLAKAAGISGPTLHQILSGHVRHSHAVPSISKMVGYPMSAIASGTVDDGDPAVQLSAVMSQLDEADEALVRTQLEALLATARSLARRSTKGDA